MALEVAGAHCHASLGSTRWTSCSSHHLFPSCRPSAHGSSTTSGASVVTSARSRRSCRTPLADHMNIRRGEVHEVVSFYSFLQVPADAVRVCTGPVCDCFGARELLARTPGAIEVACLGHCDLAPVMTRGDEIVPEVTHATNDGPAIGLGQRDETLADYAARGGLELLRSAAARSGSSTSSRRQGSPATAAPASRPGSSGRPSRASRPPVRRRQRRRGRAGDDQGSLRHGASPASLARGDAVSRCSSPSAPRATSISARSTPRRASGSPARSRSFAPRGLLDGRSLELVIGAGAYIAGEETAMLESMEGRRAMPRLRPPFPSQVGYLGRPTLINNVETLAHIPAILRNGGEWWAGLGTRGAAGTRLWSISGAVGEAGVLRGAERRHDARARRGVRRRVHGRGRAPSSLAAQRAGSCRPRRSTRR